jgi:hypothetical protein
VGTGYGCEARLLHQASYCVVLPVIAFDEQRSSGFQMARGFIHDGADKIQTFLATADEREIGFSFHLRRGSLVPFAGKIRWIRNYHMEPTVWQGLEEISLH